MKKAFYLLGPIIIISLTATVWGLYLPLEDSEIWGITSSRRIFDSPWLFSSAQMKPLFSIIFSFIVTLSPTDWSALIASRLFSSLLAFVSIPCWFGIVMRIYTDSKDRVLIYLISSVVFLLPIFVWHYSKARSDTIAVSIMLIALSLGGTFKWKSDIGKHLYIVFVSLCLLLITPKSIDLVVASLPLFFVICPSHAPRMKLRWFIWLLAPLALFFVSGFFNGFSSGSLLSADSPLKRAFNYWIQGYLDHPIYTAQHWLFFTLAFRGLPFLMGLLFFLVVTSVILFFTPSFRKKMSDSERLSILAGLTVFTATLLSSQKFPFFISSRIPFILLLVLPSWLILLRPIARLSHPFMLKTVTASLIASMAFNTLVHYHSYNGNSLAAQKAQHESVLKFLNEARITTYWDAIGLFPKRNRLFHYPSPGDKMNEDLMTFVESKKPEIIIKTDKMELLEPLLFQWLATHYAQIANAVYLRILPLDGLFDKRCQIQLDRLMPTLTDNHFMKSNLILLVRTSINTSWTRMPFSITGTTNSLPRILYDPNGFSHELEFKLRDCNVESVHYALTLEQPWQTIPPTISSDSFSYYGEL